MKISDKLAKVDDTFQVTQYDNGFKVEVRGEDPNEDWSTANILVADHGTVKDLFDEYCDMVKM
jgi:hypothetical protein